MGAVYLAEHPFMGRKAAIKVLRREFAEDPSLVERFMNEARAANAIRHPNIIDIIDVGRMPNGIPYLMMEFLEGESLSRRIGRGTLPMGEAMDVMLQTTSALAAAHAKGIVHRDLKPDNLYLVPDDSAPSGIRVKVLDFGIAKLRGDLSGSGSKTQAGSLMGTPPYMSPEQCRGVNDEVDHRTDIYAMGIILFEMLCGAPPFMSEGWGDVVLAHLTKPPPSPRSRNSAIPESLEVIIMKALAKSANDRFASAVEMRTALRSMSAVGTFPPRPTTAGMSAASGSTMQGMPVAKQPTTFRTATGEMGSINTMAESPSAKAAKSKRGLVVGASVAAVIAIGGGFVVMQGKGKSGGDVAATPAVAADHGAGRDAACARSGCEARAARGAATRAHPGSGPHQLRAGGCPRHRREARGGDRRDAVRAAARTAVGHAGCARGQGRFSAAGPGGSAGRRLREGLAPRAPEADTRGEQAGRLVERQEGGRRQERASRRHARSRPCDRTAARHDRAAPRRQAKGGGEVVRRAHA